jgi:hypothetical protein
VTSLNFLVCSLKEVERAAAGERQLAAPIAKCADEFTPLPQLR